ncbi:MAG: transmembrane 220 family protein [Opitutaceae bacterium]
MKSTLKMKTTNIILCLLMILFVGVQYNDPDGLLWVVIYSIPALGAGLLVFCPQRMTKPQVARIYYLLTAILVMLTIYYWPKTPGFWKMEVWWETETAREGLGTLIATIALAISSLTIWKSQKSQT